ncbi:MAG: RHS repeat-associated core domain-containing protein, partial [Paludibacteraceae bacterium]|nr:RHS repeat-associated core domain-containing protein [Paludibacteraceae bacterium]
ITQNISYIPYGEIFVEETTGGWQSPYYFNAKELDEETGLYYYGARYLDPAGARWLSADPMLWNNPDKTPYHYCSGNPVGLIDRMGMFDESSAESFWANNYWFDSDIHHVNIEQRENGDYQVNVGLNGMDDIVYYHGENNELNVDLPEISVVGTQKTPEPSILDKAIDNYCLGMAAADEWAGKVVSTPIRQIVCADSYSGYVSTSFGLGYGVTGTIEKVWMDGNKPFWAFSWSHGFVSSPSISLGAKSSTYHGKEKMDIDSYAGEAYSVSLGYKLLELGYSVSDDKKWHSTNIGISGSVMPYGGTSTHSNTIVVGW